MTSIESQSLANLFTWAFPGSPIQIRVRLSVINELQRLLDRPARSLQDGAPVGCGLLLGDTSQPGITEVFAFEPLSALDPATVEKTISQLPGNVVGLYRTTEKGSLRMTTDDLSLAHSHFSDPSSVVLLIETDEAGPSNAVFFFWDQGQMQGDLALLEFSFDAYQLAMSEQFRVRAIGVEQPAAQSWPRARFAGWHRRVRALPIALVLAVMAIAGYLYSTRGQRTAAAGARVQAPSAPVIGAPSLGLAVERRGSDLLLSWNRQAPPVLGASFGMVLIHEGNASRNISLNQEQLRSGSILYAPTTDQVELQLNVIAGERVHKESITAVLPPVGAAHPVVTSAQSFQVPPEPVPAVAEPKNGSAASVERELREFSISARSTAPRPAGTTWITEPPAAVSMNSGAAPIPALNWQPPGLSAPPAAPPAATLAAALPAPAPTPVSPAPVPVPVAQSKQTPVPQPPVPIHQIMPRFPAELKSLLVNNTAIEIQVSIDSGGKVVRAEPVPMQNAHLMLIQAALDAARSWTFRPATLGAKAVSSEMILKFDFAPKARWRWRTRTIGPVK